MRLLLKYGQWGLVLVALALLLAVVLVGCSDLGGGTDTSASGGASTTLGPTTTGPLASDVITTTVAVTTTDTLASTTTGSTPTTHAPASTTTSLSSAESVVEGGLIEAMGYIRDVWEEGGARYLSIDYVEMITDHDAATAAARAAGEIGPTEEWDLDYYVSNVNPLEREFVVSDSATILTTFRGHVVNLDGVPCTWADFLSFWGPGPLAEGDTQLPSGLWQIRRDGNVVVWIYQFFTP